MNLDQSIDRANKYSQRIRANYFGPLLLLLDRLNITPNILSLLRILAGLTFFLLIKQFFYLALIVLIFGLLTDIIDGPLARYQKTASDRGKFIDIFSDGLIFCFFLLGLIRISFFSQSILAYTLFIISSLYLLVAINKNEKLPSDWLISPVARVSYYKLAIEILFIIKLLSNLPATYLDNYLLLINIIATIHVGRHYWSFIFKSQA